MSSNKKIRICKKCKVSKPISQFNKDGKYFRTECKKCILGIKYKEKLSCSVCGYSKKTNKNFSSRALEFHHTKNNKSFSVSNGIAQGKGIKTIKKEIDKCIVVCSRCHAEIHSKQT
jgi:DNA-directed RNA polymerase subunit M/transcription elongation factor TFIIS